MFARKQTMIYYENLAVKREVRYVREEGKAIKSWRSDRVNRLDGELLEMEELLECPKDLEQGKEEKLSNLLV